MIFESLLPLCRQGHARVPERWGLEGPVSAGLWWRASGAEVVATPAVLRLAAQLPTDGERAGLLLASDARFRSPWVGLAATRLADLGRRGEVAELCRQVGILGPASRGVRHQLLGARLAPTDSAALEIALFGVPADQPAATPGLLRVLGLTGPLIEGEQGRPHAPLPPVHPRDPEVNWIAGRLLQVPNPEAQAGTAVLSGTVPAPSPSRMEWVLETPWVTLLAVLAFTAEAWAAERQGGLQLELPPQHLQHFTQPPEVQVVVTLADGREVLCGTLGELCLRVLDGLGMALVPTLDIGALNQRLGSVVHELLLSGVWAWRPETRPQYVIGEAFGFDCYRGEGHTYIYLGAERLSQTLRSVAVTWARERVERAGQERRL